MFEHIQNKAHLLAIAVLSYYAWAHIEVEPKKKTLTPEEQKKLPPDKVPKIESDNMPRRAADEPDQRLADCFRAGKSSRSETGLDPNNELDETIVLTLDQATNATLGEDKVHTVRVIDDDVPPVISFSLTEQTAVESAGAVTAQLVLDGPAALDVTGTYQLSGTATDGTDYGGFTGTYTIPAGATSVVLTGLLTDDVDGAGVAAGDGGTRGARGHRGPEFSLTLESVLELPGRRQAHISGRTVRVGEALIGFDLEAPPRVESVRDGVVRVSHRGTFYALDLEDRPSVVCRPGAGKPSLSAGAAPDRTPPDQGASDAAPAGDAVEPAPDAAPGGAEVEAAPSQERAP